MSFLHPWQASTELHLRLAQLLHMSEDPEALLPVPQALYAPVFASSPVGDNATAQAAAAAALSLVL